MKNIKKLLVRKGSTPTKGQLPEISPWVPIHTLSLEGGALQFTESRVLGLRGNNECECFEVAVTNGEYSVECCVARYGIDARIAGLRTFSNAFEHGEISRGAKIKELPVDLGGIAVVDIGAVHASMQEDEERHEEWLEEILYGDPTDQVAVHTWKPTKTKIPVVSSGFGDGAYSLYPLLNRAMIVGLEVEFISATEGYPI